MNRKGMALKSIIAIAIMTLCAFMIIMSFLSPEGFFGTVADSATGLADKFFGDMSTKETFEKPKAGIPVDLSDAVNNLYIAMNQRNDNPCSLTHPLFPDDFNDFSIRLVQNEKDISFFMVNPKGQVIDMLYEIPDKELCVVAGEIDGNLATEAFFKQYINPGQATTDKKYLSVSSIEISGGEIAYVSMVSELKVSGLRNFGVLYNHDERHTCFMPSKNSIFSKYDLSGLGDAYIENVKEGKGVLLKKCSEVEEKSGKTDETSDESKAKEEGDSTTKQIPVDCSKFTNICQDAESKVVCESVKIKDCPEVGCFWDTNNIDECLKCDMQGGCKQYEDEINCKKNTCNIIKDCEWKFAKWYSIFNSCQEVVK